MIKVPGVTKYLGEDSELVLTASSKINKGRLDKRMEASQCF